MIPFGALHATPFVPWEVVRDLTNPVWIDGESIQIVYYDIRRRAFSKRAPVAESCRLRR